MCKGPLPSNPISDGSVLYTQEPKFLMSISGLVFQLVPMKFFKSQENLTLKDFAALLSKKSLTCSRTVVLQEYIPTLTMGYQKP